nr:MAG TPA: hypothetical protein [Caudoviricetes sp.]
MVILLITWFINKKHRGNKKTPIHLEAVLSFIYLLFT